MQIEAAGSLLLLLAAAVALIWANSPWASSYDALWAMHVGVDLGPIQLSESLGHWVNDALMVVFFFVVGLEIKYELVHGDLHDLRTAALPIIAAVGGMLVPAAIYAAFNATSAGAAGWGIPMATDIAFAVGVLGVLGRRIPPAARLFLLTLAVVDDIGAIVVIAIFYTADLALDWLALSLGLLAVMVLMRQLRVWAVPAYVPIGVAVWFCLLQSGVHATLAGVAIGLLTPATALLNEPVAREHAKAALADNQLDAEESARLWFLLRGAVPPVERLQAVLHPISAYVVLPIFALANAGVALSGFTAAITSAVGLGVGLGLVVGKPVGILLACWLGVRAGWGRLPTGTTWPMLLGLGCVAGVGFTVSLFIAGLSFPGQALLAADAKVGILVGSLVAAACGVGLLLAATSRRTPALAQQPHI